VKIRGARQRFSDFRSFALLGVKLKQKLGAREKNSAKKVKAPSANEKKCQISLFLLLLHYTGSLARAQSCLAVMS
jgi:hypothetical protein